MGAAAAVPKENGETCQKPATSSKSQNHNKTATVVICSGCKIPLSIFKRKKCTSCTQLHCSRCLVARNGCFSGQPACAKCLSLVMGDYTHDYLARHFTVRELRQFLSGHKVPIDGCTEKHDLIDLVMQLRRTSAAQAEADEHARHVMQLRENMSRELQSDIVSSVDRSSSGIADEQLESQLLHPENPSASSVAMTSDAVSPTAETNITDDADVDERGTVSNGTSYPTHQSDTSIGALPCNSEVSDNVTAEMSSPRDDADNVLPPPPLTKNTVQHRIGLADIMSDADINTLTVQQLKRLLVNNYVDYRGCCEKQELVERVHELWSDHRKLNPPADTAANEVQGDDLCKVCMDAMVNCILLECGHMVSCTDCGKRLAECPVCRRYVSRVVRAFRA